ncbi:MAG: 50S ribosomal protein L25 [Verrucomicrobia bacterium]|nr:50S ribosomal protein L25 [Verrucomicrobiota bacterium]
MQKYSLNVKTRNPSNKGSLKQLRKAGEIPGNIYGKGNARAISVSTIAFRNVNKEIGGGAGLIELKDETGELALTHVKGVQVNPISRIIEHIDFHEVARGESFDSKVPVVLTGVNDCLGVKNEGGMLDHKTLELEIRCRPSKLPENISVDVSNLNVGDAIHVDDLEAIEDVEFLNTGIQVIVSCQPPTVAVAADTESADDSKETPEGEAASEASEGAEETDSDNSAES